MRFFVLGDVSVNLLYFLDRIPEPGEKIPAPRALLQPAEARATSAAQLASLGHRVHLAGRVGEDAFRPIALSALEGLGMDLRELQLDPEHPTSAVLILLVPGGSAE